MTGKYLPGRANNTETLAASSGSSETRTDVSKEGVVSIAVGAKVPVEALRRDATERGYEADILRLGGDRERPSIGLKPCASLKVLWSESRPTDLCDQTSGP